MAKEAIHKYRTKPDREETGFRRIKILEELKEASDKGNHVSITELSKRFSVSSVTILRDIQYWKDLLSEQVYSGYGEAWYQSPTQLFTRAFEVRLRQNYALKEEVASTTAELIKPGSRLIIGSGTTAYLVAKQLTMLNKVLEQVYTENLAALIEFSRYSGTSGLSYLSDIIVSGEILEDRPSNLKMPGMIFYRQDSSAESKGYKIQKGKDKIIFDECVLSFNGIDTNSVIYFSEDQFYDKKFWDVSKKIYLLFDHTKINPEVKTLYKWDFKSSITNHDLLLVTDSRAITAQRVALGSLEKSINSAIKEGYIKNASFKVLYAGE